MTIPDEWAAVVTALERGTKNGKLRWQAQGSGSVFRVSLKNQTIAIWEYTDEKDFSDFPSGGMSMQLIDNAGKSRDMFAVPDADKDSTRLRALHGTARRQALGIDTELQEVAAELQEVLAAPAKQPGDKDGKESAPPQP